MKAGQSASFGGNSVANVVLPAPFGPAMMNIFLSLASAKAGPRPVSAPAR